MLINLWYVAEWSDKVKDKPLQARVLGQNLVLFRDHSGAVRALSDICIHRGGALSDGWTSERDCVACPYHGWEFDGEGRLQFIPSRGDGEDVPEHVRTDAYPTAEHYGMIWVFMGDLPEVDRYPVPPFPEYEDRANWRPIHTEFSWQADVNRVVENGIDIAHTSFVNPGFYLSGHCLRLHIKVNSWMEMIIFDANTPVDENHTRSFVVQVRNFFKWGLFDRSSVKRTLNVLCEDAAIAEALSPHYLPESVENEVSVEQDKFLGAWRKVRKVHVEEKGWKIDTTAMAPLLKEKAFTIPSPARRANPQQRWALDTVPLVPPLR